MKGGQDRLVEEINYESQTRRNDNDISSAKVVFKESLLDME